MPEDFSSYLPLSPATLHILLSLAGEERHGYGMMQEVARQSEGRYKLGPGTLYDNLQKLMMHGLVEGPPPPAGRRSAAALLPPDARRQRRTERRNRPPGRRGSRGARPPWTSPGRAQ